MTDFVDADAYQGSAGSDELSFQLILLQHLQRITRLASTEFHGGFWYPAFYSQGGQGPIVKRYMPAANEAYSNAVDCLADLLAPYYDADMIDADDAHQKALDAAKDALKDDDGKYVVELWYREKVVLQRRFFRVLVRFVKRSGLLEGATFEEEVVQ